MAELEPDQNSVISRWPLALVAIFALGLLLYLLQPILLPFVLGALIAYLGDPLVDVLERRRVNRTLGVIIVFVLFTTVSVAVIGLALPMLLQQLDLLLQKIPAVYQWLRQALIPWVQQQLGVYAVNLPQIDWSGELADNWESLGKVTAQTIRKLTGSGAGLLLILANLALVPVVAFYLMRDWDVLVGRALRMLPVAWQDNTSHMVREADEVVGAFIRGQFLVMCSLAAIYSVGLWMVGLQLAFLLGLIAGSASIVPYLGFMVGIIASCIAAYAQFHEWGMLLWVVLVFGIGQALESMVLTPVLVGDRIGLHPVAVIFVLMAGGQIGGVVGVLAALPVAAVLMVFLRHALAHYRASDLYGGE